jgi:hypothetical protein
MADSLNDLVEGVQYAVMEAQEIAEEHHMALVSRFFEKDDDGKEKAITQTIYVPNMNPATKEEQPFVQVDVPLICLAQLGGIKIKELKVTFVANLSSLDTEEEVEEKKAEEAADEAEADAATPEPLKRLGRRARKKGRRLRMGMKKGGGADEFTKATIEICFVGTDPPEGAVRVNDRLLKTIP